MTLPVGKTHADAVERAVELREQLWSHAGWMRRPEDERIDELTRLCTKLYGGDVKAGQALATEAIHA